MPDRPVRKTAGGRLAEFFSLSGRASGTYVLVAYLGLLMLSGFAGALGETFGPLRREVVQTAVMALVIPTFVRRMHDNGRSGWWAAVPAVGLVPRLGEVDLPLSGTQEGLALLLVPFFFWGLYLLAAVSDGDAEHFGPDPRARAD